MNQVQTFADVPVEKLDELVKSLELEVPRDAIEVNRQSNGQWEVRVLVEEVPPASGATPGSQPPANAPNAPAKRSKF